MTSIVVTKTLLSNSLNRTIIIIFIIFNVLSPKQWAGGKYVSLKNFLQQGISEPEFFGVLVYRFRRIVGKSNYSEQFRKLIGRYKSIGYNLDIMRQTACLVINPIPVDSYALLLNFTAAARASVTASS